MERSEKELMLGISEHLVQQANAINRMTHDGLNSAKGTEWLWEASELVPGLIANARVLEGRLEVASMYSRIKKNKGKKAKRIRKLENRLSDVLKMFKETTDDETRLLQLQCEIDNLAEDRWDGPVPSDHPDITGSDGTRKFWTK